MSDRAIYLFLSCPHAQLNSCLLLHNNPAWTAAGWGLLLDQSTLQPRLVDYYSTLHAYGYITPPVLLITPQPIAMHTQVDFTEK